MRARPAGLTVLAGLLTAVAAVGLLLSPAFAAPTSSKKKAAPVEAETAVTESSPVAAENAEGTEAADAPVKKPRAKKAPTKTEA